MNPLARNRVPPAPLRITEPGSGPDSSLVLLMFLPVPKFLLRFWRDEETNQGRNGLARIHGRVERKLCFEFKGRIILILSKDFEH